MLAWQMVNWKRLGANKNEGDGQERESPDIVNSWCFEYQYMPRVLILLKRGG